MAISVDAPPQHAALLEKLELPFPMLSDPDRSGAIEPYGVADEKDPRIIARPAVFLVSPSMQVAYDRISRDFADRPTEDEILEAVRSLGLPPAAREDLLLGPAEPGAKAMPLSAMEPYYRGAKFAITAMRIRHPDLAEETERYIDELDRYLAATQTLKQHRGEGRG